MGTADFAVPSLSLLVSSKHNIVGVITAPDKPAGRGLQLHESAVKKYAVSKGLKLLQPKNLKDPEFLEELRSLKADLQVVVAFRMLPEVVWNMPPLGTVNLHASLLPQYRGAAPVNWAIINGAKETGVTTFKLQQEIDTGNILLQKKVAIGDEESAGELYDRLKELGAQLLLETIEQIRNKTIREIPQQNADTNEHIQLQLAPKINTETCRIDWNKNVDEVYNLIRGLSPYPAAYTTVNKKIMKIFRAKKEVTNRNTTTGNIDTDRKSYLKFSCPDGNIIVEELQMEGRKKMNVVEFLRGYRWPD